MHLKTALCACYKYSGIQRIQERIQHWTGPPFVSILLFHRVTDAIPADAVTASGSGLDPHITVRNAELQMARVAKARGLRDDTLRTLIAKNTDRVDFGFLGEPGVNVLRLNLALDSLR